VRYIYGITEGLKGGGLGEVGLNRAEVTTVTFKDLCALSSEVLIPEDLTPEDARLHENVILKAMDRGTVIPVSFGLLVKDDDEVRALLRQGYHALKETVERLRNMIQADVSISWDSRILAQVFKGEGRVRAVYEELNKDPNSLTLKIELGRMVKEALSKKETELAPKVLSRLKRLSRGYMENRVEGHETILNSSFLLDGERKESFIAEVSEIERDYEGMLTPKCIIPLPVYSFVGIRVKRPDREALEEARRILGLADEVSISEVNVVFKKMARTVHPDRSLSPRSDARFEALRRARDVLIEYCENYPCPLERTEIEGRLIISRNLR